MRWVLLIGLAALAACATADPEGAADKPPRGVGNDLHGDRLPAQARCRLGTVRLRHPPTIEEVLVSADGSILASCAWGEVVLWDARTGRRLREIKGESPLTFSALGKYLATGWKNENGVWEGLVVWNVASGKEVRRLGGARVCAFAPEDNLLAVGWADGSVSIEHLGKNKVSLKVKTHKDAVLGLAFSRDGRRLASAGAHEGVLVLDARSGVELKRFVTGGDSNFVLQFSEDGTRLALKATDTALQYSKVQLWSVDSERQLIDSQGDWFFAFAPDFKTLATAGLGECLRLWSARDGQLIHEIKGLEGWATFCGFAKGGTRLVCATYRPNSLDMFIRAWDAASGKQVFELKPIPQTAVPTWALGVRVAVTPDGPMFVAQEGTLQPWDLATGKPAFAFEAHQTSLTAVAYLRRGDRIVTCSRDGSVRLWDARTGEARGRIPVEGYTVGRAALSPDGNRIATFGPHSSINLWDCVSGNRLRFVSQEDGVGGGAFSPNGKLFASADLAGAVYIRDAETLREIRRMGDTSDPFGPGELAFSPDGKTLACSAASGIHRIRLWDLETGLVTRRIELRSPATSIVFGRDARWLAAASDAESWVRVWDLAEGKLLFQLERTEPVYALALSPDGNLLAAAMGDHVRLWEVETWQEVLRLEGHEWAVTSVALSSDARSVVSGSDDTTALVWDLTRPRSAREASEVSLAQAWHALVDRSAETAYEAMRALASAGDAAARFLEKAMLVFPPVPERILEMIRGLDHEDPTVRDRTSDELVMAGWLAYPALDETQRKGPNPEIQDRARRILDRIEGWPTHSLDVLRALRAIQVLEWIGSAAARKTLESLARQSPSSRLRAEAREAAVRLVENAR